MSAKTLTLDVSGKDRAAVSILYAYLYARGVDVAGGKDLAIKIAQQLADSPDDELGTACQTWDHFLLWPNPMASNMQVHSEQCTLRDAMLGAGSAGYEVAAIVLRRTDEKDREWYVEQKRERLNELHQKALAESNSTCAAS